MMEKNLSPYSTNTTWIENLALEEIGMEESGVIDFDPQARSELLIEEESVRFMDRLRDLFEIYTTQFNELRSNQGDNTKTIKIFKISNTVNDFMLFRNSLKLIIARKSPECISIGFLSNTGTFYSPRTANQKNNCDQQIHEIRAHLGPFHEISWQFQGEKVSHGALVKHYLTEFIRLSAR